MICATILTLGFVSPANVYTEQSYIVDTANSGVSTASTDCSINTSKVLADSQFYWDAPDDQLAQWLSKWNIVADLTQLDDMSVTQEFISEDQIP